jgi:hypothetical protein
LGGKESVVREDEEGFAVRAAENELQRALGNVDLRNRLARGREDEDLAVGDIDIALAIDGDTLAAALGEGFEVSERAVGVYFGAVRDVFRFAADINVLARLGDIAVTKFLWTSSSSGPG